MLHYEVVDSPVLQQYLESQKPQVVSVKFEVFYDFGDIRGWGLKDVDGISIGSGWTGGETPGEEFR